MMKNNLVWYVCTYVCTYNIQGGAVFHLGTGILYVKCLFQNLSRRSVGQVVRPNCSCKNWEEDVGRKEVSFLFFSFPLFFFLHREIHMTYSALLQVATSFVLGAYTKFFWFCFFPSPHLRHMYEAPFTLGFYF